MNKKQLTKIAKAYNRNIFKKRVRYCLKLLKKNIKNRAKTGHYELCFQHETIEWAIAVRYFRMHSDCIVEIEYVPENDRWIFKIGWYPVIDMPEVE